MNNAYLRSVFNDTYIVSGLMFMPFKPQIEQQTGKAVNSFGQNVYPILLSIGMAAFLNNIVMEKEQRLL
jgi:hypothetical protein